MENNILQSSIDKKAAISTKLSHIFSLGTVTNIKIAEGRKDGAPTEVVSYYLGTGLPDFGGDSYTTTAVKETPEEVQRIVKDITGRDVDITDQPLKNGFRRTLRSLGL